MASGPAWVKNIRFEDVRCEERVECNNLTLMIVDPGLYGGNGVWGHIQGVYLKNVTWANSAIPIVLQGNSSTNLVDSVTFDNCRVGTTLLTKASDYSRFQMNSFVHNVFFTNTGTRTVPSAGERGSPRSQLMNSRMDGKTLRIAVKEPGACTISVSRLDGKLVRAIDATGPAEYAVNAEDLHAGLYVVTAAAKGRELETIRAVR
jgi:hypothetical protein